MHIPHIIPLSLLSFSLLSCSSGTDVYPAPKPDTPQVGISFGGKGGVWQDAPTSRARSVGLETLYGTFRVWGYKTTDAAQNMSQVVMDGYNVVHTDASATTTSNTAGWEYVGIANPNLAAMQTIKYWDYAASSYRFMGYSPMDANMAVDATQADASSPSLAFTYPYEYDADATQLATPYLSELWYGTNDTASQGYGNSVTITFMPMIAKVCFKFAYPSGTETIDIKDIVFCDTRFKNTPSTADTPLRGTITAIYPLTGNPTDASPTLSWTDATDSPTGNLVLTIPYEQEGDPIHILTDKSLYGKWYYVPPFSIIPYEQGSYTITALIDGNRATATVPAEFMQWKPGFQYTYIFKITEAGTAINFANLQVEQWQPGTGIDNKGSGTEGW